MSVSVQDTQTEFYIISKNKALSHKAMARNNKSTGLIRNKFQNDIRLYLKTLEHVIDDNVVLNLQRNQPKKNIFLLSAINKVQRDIQNHK